MPRSANTEAKVRLNLELPERVRERLERVRVMSEADSLTEVIRRAMSIYDTLLTTSKEGGGAGGEAPGTIPVSDLVRLTRRRSMTPTERVHLAFATTRQILPGHLENPPIDPPVLAWVPIANHRLNRHRNCLCVHDAAFLLASRTAVSISSFCFCLMLSAKITET